MNIEAYDADSLRKMVRLLEYENKILKDKLKKAGISYEEVNPFEEKIESAEEYDLDQGSRIVNPPYITEKMAIRFFSMFWGREDVYARRGKNGGYFPQCANRWKASPRCKRPLRPAGTARNGTTGNPARFRPAKCARTLPRRTSEFQVSRSAHPSDFRERGSRSALPSERQSPRLPSLREDSTALPPRKRLSAAYC